MSIADVVVVSAAADFPPAVTGDGVAVPDAHAVSADQLKEKA